MQTTEQAAKRLPFHETIVNAIRQVNSARELMLLATLIKATKIPKGHDEITAAWKTQWMSWFNNDLGVPADLLEQKQEAEKEEEKKTKGQVAAATS